MRFEWDEKKNRVNEAKHDLSFEVAVKAFADPNGLVEVNARICSEDRYHVIGLVRGQLVVLVVYTVMEEGKNETYRIISARKANKSERGRYAEAADQ